MSEKPKSTPKAKSVPRTPWEMREALFDASMSPEERREAVFGEETPPQAKVEEASELDPKLKERVESLMETMYEQIGRMERATPNPWAKRGEEVISRKDLKKFRLGEYEIAGEDFGEGYGRYINFTRDGETLRFWFETPGMLFMRFNDNEVASYGPPTPNSKLHPEGYHNVALLVGKLEKFSALLPEIKVEKVEEVKVEVENF